MATATANPKMINIGTGTNWATALLQLIGAPLTAANYRFLNQWAYREQPHKGNTYVITDNNPLNTTAGGGGSAGPFKPGQFPTLAGTPGVSKFPDITSGVLANAYTLQQYPGIVAALQSGHPQAYTGNSTFQKELLSWSGSSYSGFASINQPGTPQGPSLTVPIENVSAADFWSGKGGAVAIGAALGTGAELLAGGSAAGIGGAEAAGVGAGAGVGTKTALDKLLSDAAKAGGGAAATVAIWDWLKARFVRLGEVVGGFLLILIGLFLLARQIGLATNPPGPVGTAVGAVS